MMSLPTFLPGIIAVLHRTEKVEVVVIPTPRRILDLEERILLQIKLTNGIHTSCTKDEAEQALSLKFEIVKCNICNKKLKHVVCQIEVTVIDCTSTVPFAKIERRICACRACTYNLNFRTYKNG
ncbi:MAG: hypothetical protein WC451_02655 [Patescibacteria group bacterium]